ncbi:MAG: S41 family peptidase [Clostridiaceae bacterium]|nr:S41 family peptidase [Clostridiaceae bacterium]
MKRRYSIGTVVAAILLTAAVTFNICYVAIWDSFSDRLSALSERESEYAKLNEIRAYLSEYYILNDLENDTLIEGAAEGMISALPDGWSYYMNASDYAASLDTASDDFVGIGVTAYFDESAGLRVTEVYTDSPAHRAGIRFFDLITAVDGRDTLALGSTAAFDTVRGEEGTDVVLTIFRASTGETQDITVTRERITERELQSELLEGNIGYIRISSFSENANTQFRAAVEELITDGAQSFIFDVRFNPGGRLDVLADMLDLLLPEGTLIRWVDKKGIEGTLSSDASYIDMPMVVLAHEYSYSAAEFFAAALQEYGAATVVGMKTTGKCYAQTTYKLSDGSAIAISTLQYTTPSGKSLGGIGITPDYEVPLTYEETVNFSAMTFAEDPQMQKAIELLSK